MSREAISPITIAIILVLLAALSGGIAYWWMARAPQGGTPDGAVANVSDEAPSEASPSAPVEATEPRARPDLPPLSASDGVLREWVGKLSKHPELAR